MYNMTTSCHPYTQACFKTLISGEQTLFATPHALFSIYNQSDLSLGWRVMLLGDQWHSNPRNHLVGRYNSDFYG
jgi:hypothetical protein